MCTGTELEYYFFADVDNSTPVQGNNFKFSFEILNTKFKIDDKKWKILPFIKRYGETEYTAITNKVVDSNEYMEFNTTDINNNLSMFIFKAFQSEDLMQRYITDHTSEGKVVFVVDDNLTSDEIAVDVAGCNNADWFVSTTGSDDNPGDSPDYPFRTLEKAISACNGSKNTIAILNGEYTLPRPVDIRKNINLIGCNDVLVECGSPYFFSIYNDCHLNISNIRLGFMEHLSVINQANFINKSPTTNPLHAGLDVILLVADAGLNGTLQFTNKTNSPKETIANRFSMTDTHEEWDYIDISNTGDNSFFEVRPESDNPRLLIHNTSEIEEYKQRMLEEHK